MRPVVYCCGCGGIKDTVNRILTSAGVDPKTVDIVVDSSNTAVKTYLKTSGLIEAEPALKRSKHAVLYNPTTHKFINLLSGKKDKLSNVYLVAQGL